MTTDKIYGLIQEELNSIGKDADQTYAMGHKNALQNLIRRINHGIQDELNGNMTELGERNFTIIVEAIKTQGSYDPDEIFFMFEEQLYVHESDVIYKFLQWVVSGGFISSDSKAPVRGFGHGNYEQRFQEFLVDNVIDAELVEQVYKK